VSSGTSLLSVLCVGLGRAVDGTGSSSSGFGCIRMKGSSATNSLLIQTITADIRSADPAISRGGGAARRSTRDLSERGATVARIPRSARKERRIPRRYSTRELAGVETSLRA